MTTLRCGHEVRDEQQTHYCSYLRLADLTALQPAAHSLGHHDELLFIITHQTAELWFKLILHELETIIDLLQRDCVGSATWLLHRVDQVLELLIKQIQLLNTMAPQDFFAFRAALAPASGGESIQFRMLEIRSGLRDTQRHRAVLDAPVCPMQGKGVATHLLTPALAEAYARPSLWDAFRSLLERRGTTIAALYTPLGQDGPNHDLFRLAEALLTYDQQFGLWRAHHVAMVERMLSRGTHGTGTTSGVGYLEGTLRYPHFFPELWEVRAALWQQRDGMDRSPVDTPLAMHAP